MMPNCKSLLESHLLPLRAAFAAAILLGFAWLGPLTHSAQAQTCSALIDKEVSCDGGATFVDSGLVTANDDGTFSCQGFEAVGARPPDQIVVRYSVQNTSDEGVTLQNCTLTDSSQVIAPPAAPDLATNDIVTLEDVPVGECTLDLDDEEPNTAELACECAVDGEPFDMVAVSDQAEFRCDTCGVEISKAISCEQAEGQQTEFGDEGCTAWNSHSDPVTGEVVPAENITARYEFASVGTVDVTCTPTEDNPGLGLTDTNLGLIPSGVDVGMSEGGVFGASPLDVTAACSDELAAAEPDTATLACLCNDRDGEPTDVVAGAADDSLFFCETPGLEVTKVCDTQVQGSNAVTITSRNTGEAELINCNVTDTLFPDDPLCDDGTTGDSEELMATPGTFDLASGSEVGSTLSIPGLLGDACNTVSVTCEIADSGGKTITDEAEDECEAFGDDCLSRSPGFWGAHPEIADPFLPLSSCGVEINNTLAGMDGSAVEDLCSVGRDPKDECVFGQQVQLERQCMAANLNFAATMEEFDSSCDNAFPGAAQMLAECCNMEGSVCTSALTPGEEAVNSRTINGCIEALDAFNNNNAAEPEDLSGTPFETPGPADPSACQNSKNNGFLNTRDRAESDRGQCGNNGNHNGPNANSNSKNPPAERFLLRQRGRSGR